MAAGGEAVARTCAIATAEGAVSSFARIVGTGSGAGLPGEAARPVYGADRGGPPPFVCGSATDCAESTTDCAESTTGRAESTTGRAESGLDVHAHRRHPHVSETGMPPQPPVPEQPAPDPFAPVCLGPLTLRNRVIRSATFEGVTPEGLVTDELIAYHRRPAAGGVGMTTVAYCAVAPEGRTERRQIWMRPEAVPGLRRLTDAVHREGAAISAQLGHAGPVADARSNRLPALAPGRFLSPLGMRMTRAATADDIARVVRAHATAARLAVESGFDAVELHFGHNYLASSFLSPRLNHRDDAYGGGLDNRARVALGIARAVRDEVGDTIAITAKLNMDDGVPGGFWLDESLRVARRLQEDGTVDALELTAGSSLFNPMYLFRGEAPLTEFAAVFPRPARLGIRLAGGRFLRSYPYEEAYLLPSARQFRAALSLPLILLGGITRRETVELAMTEGFEYVAMARALLREPDLVNRMRDRPGTRSLCIHCNKCVPTIYTGTHCPLAGPAPGRPGRPARGAADVTFRAHPD
ncbi:NADH:flavin oxidoreductase [Streptomyces sp. NPDC014734]|uniref:NADH:flavin oxidoreductase n=1 Tax=Streptomyces sp. NPDC014734 TaxID=3364886 RepID=UPI0036FD5BC9